MITVRADFCAVPSRNKSAFDMQNFHQLTPIFRINRSPHEAESQLKPWKK
jgi:hypothetical protein